MTTSFAFQENTSSLVPRALSIAGDSHTITKTKKQKIRIVHVVTPEIIKIDAMNFRELVQSLTGKNAKSTKKVSRRKTKKVGPSAPPAPKIELDEAPYEGGFGLEEWIKEEDCGSTCLGDVGDMDVFFHSIFQQCPQLPSNSTSS